MRHVPCVCEVRIVACRVHVDIQVTKIQKYNAKHAHVCHHIIRIGLRVAEQHQKVDHLVCSKNKHHTIQLTSVASRVQLPVQSQGKIGILGIDIRFLP